MFINKKIKEIQNRYAPLQIFINNSECFFCKCFFTINLLIIYENMEFLKEIWYQKELEGYFILKKRFNFIYHNSKDEKDNQFSLHTKKRNA